LIGSLCDVGRPVEQAVSDSRIGKADAGPIERNEAYARLFGSVRQRQRFEA
jgi:hypothetical protein